MTKNQDQYNFQFLDSVPSRSSIDICNFAYEATPYFCDSNLKSETLETRNVRAQL